MKKIILFTDSLTGGGAQRQLVGLAVMLKDKGYCVKVCTYHPLDFYKHYLDQNGVENEIIPGAQNTKKRIFAVRDYFKKEAPDLVIAYQETPSLVACAARLLGAKYKLLVSERNTTQQLNITNRIRFFLYRWADSIVPNSHTQEKFLSSKYPWMKKRISTITNFVDLDKFRYTVPQQSNCKKILVVATLFEPKNALGLIEALHILKGRNLDFHIDWFGKTDAYNNYYNACCDLIKKYQLESHITIHEKSKDIQAQYAKCHIFCLPSFYEGTPNVICEAMATGRAIICSNVCDNSYYVRDYENGFLFDPTNHNDIANAIEQALTLSDQELLSFGQKSRKIAEDKLSKTRFLDEYLKIIEN